MATEQLTVTGGTGWSNPTNASASDGVFATTSSKNVTGVFDLSNPLSITDADTVTNFTLAVSASTTGSGGRDSLDVGVRINGALLGTLVRTTNLSGSVSTYGLPQDAAWAQDWTKADLDTLQVEVTSAQTGMNSAATWQLDHINFSVVYTPAPADANVTANTSSLNLVSSNATVSLTQNASVTASTSSLALVSSNATVSMGVDQEITASTAGLSLTSQSASVVTTSDLSVTASTGALGLTASNASIQAEVNLSATASTANLSIVASNATVSLGADLDVVASTASLSVASTNASIGTGQDLTLTATTSALSLSTSASTVALGSDLSITATTASLSVASSNATVSLGADLNVVATTASLSASASNAVVALGSDLSITATTGALSIGSTSATVTMSAPPATSSAEALGGFALGSRTLGGTEPPQQESSYGESNELGLGTLGTGSLGKGAQGGGLTGATTPIIATTLTAPTVTGTHSDIVLRITEADIGSELLSAVYSKGDIRAYTDATKSTQLPIDVLELNAQNQTFLMWVKMPTLATGSTIYLEADPANSAIDFDGTYGRNAVWSNYEAVWHMRDGSLVDSTGNGYDATNQGITALDDRFDFPGTYNTSLFFPSTGTFFDGNGDYEISVWADFDAIYRQCLFAPRADYNIYFGILDSGQIQFSTGNQSLNGDTIASIDTPYYIHASYAAAGNMELYLNGSGDGTPVTSIAPNSYSTDNEIGNNSDGHVFDGQLHGLRVRRSVTSGTFKATEYDNQTTSGWFTSNGWAEPLANYGTTLTAPATVVGTHSNFISVITEADLPTEMIDGSASSIANGGGNLRAYTNSSKTTQLPLEVVTFVTGATPSVEVHVRHTMSASATIYLEKDGSATEQPLATDQFGRNSVFSEYSDVWHQGGGVNSTGGNELTLFDGTQTGVFVGNDATMPFGTATSFNGYDVLEGAADTPALLYTDDYFWSAWVYSPDNNTTILFGNRWGNASPLTFTKLTSNAFEYYTPNGNMGIPSHQIPTSTWHKVDIVKDGNVLRYYRNGAIVTTATLGVGDDIPAQPFHVGGDTATGSIAECTFGSVGQVRRGTYVRDADWIATEYDNQSTSGWFSNNGWSNTWAIEQEVYTSTENAASLFSGTTISLPLLRNPIAGNILFSIFSTSNNGTHFSAPSGWTLASEAAVNGSQGYIGFAYKVADGTETNANWTSGIEVTNWYVDSWAVEISGLKGTAPHVPPISSSSGGALVTELSTGTTQATTANNVLAIAGWARDNVSHLDTVSYSNGFESLFETPLGNSMWIAKKDVVGTGTIETTISGLVSNPDHEMASVMLVWEVGEATSNTDLNLNVTTEAITLTPSNASISFGSDLAITATTATLAIASSNASIVTGSDLSITATTSALSVIATGASVSTGADLNITATSATISTAATAATVTTGSDLSVTATTDALSLATTNASVSTGSDLNINVGSAGLGLAQSSASVSLGSDRAITASTDSLSISTVNASVTTGVDLAVTATTASLALSGGNAVIGLGSDLNIGVSTAGLSIVESNASISLGSDLSITASTASISVAPSSASVTLGSDSSITASSVNLSVAPTSASVGLGSDLSVTASTASLSLTQDNASISLGSDLNINVSPSPLSLATENVSLILGSDLSIVATSTGLSVVESNASVGTGSDLNISVTTDSFALSSDNTSVVTESDRNIGASSAAIAIASNNATVSTGSDRTLTVSSESLTIASSNVAIATGDDLAINAGNAGLTVAPTNATVVAESDLAIVASTDSLVINSTNATVEANVDLAVTASTESLAVVSSNAAISTGSDRNIIVSQVAQTITSTNATISAGSDRAITANTDSFAITSSNATVEIQPDIDLTISNGTLTITSSNASVIATVDLTATVTTESLSISTNNPTVDTWDVLDVEAEPVNLVITATSAFVVAQRNLSLDVEGVVMSLTPSNGIINQDGIAPRIDIYQELMGDVIIYEEL